MQYAGRDVNVFCFMGIIWVHCDPIKSSSSFQGMDIPDAYNHWCSLVQHMPIHKLVSTSETLESGL